MDHILRLLDLNHLAQGTNYHRKDNRNLHQNLSSPRNKHFLEITGDLL